MNPRKRNKIDSRTIKHNTPKNEDTDIELREQAWAFTEFWNRYPSERQLLHGNDNNSGNVQTGAQKIGLGTVPGVSDFEYGKRSLTHFIEFKTAKGTQSAEQVKFQNKVESEGFPYYIVRNRFEGLGLFILIMWGYKPDPKLYR